jgi:capsular exopolysaccharide synthesis family protein
LIVGCGLALVSDWRDQRLRSSEEIQASLGLQVLGVVPEMVGAMSQSHRGMKVYMDPASDIAEAYRTVRTAMYFGLPEDARTVLVTSPSAGDGKSTLVSNLAISMAQAGRRVLVVDADFRLPVQHKIFDVQVDVGLSAVMAGQASLDDAIIPTAIENLDLLPCGALPNNPSELLNSRAFAEVLGELAADYDCVLLDSPALMAVADARIASAWCDATVLVVHATRTNRKMAKMAREGLAAVGANIVGVVVNDVSLRDNQHGFYARFGYGVTPVGREGHDDGDRALTSPRQGRRKNPKAAGETNRREAPVKREAEAPRPSTAVAVAAVAPAVISRPVEKPPVEPEVVDATEEEAASTRLHIHHEELDGHDSDQVADTNHVVEDEDSEDAFIIEDDAPAEEVRYADASFEAETVRTSEGPVHVEVPRVALDSDSLAARESDANTFESTAPDAGEDVAASTDGEADTHGGADDDHGGSAGHANGTAIHEHIPGPRSPTDPAALAEQSRKLRDRMIALRHGRG